MSSGHLALAVLLGALVASSPVLADEVYTGVFESASERRLALDASGVVASVEVAVGDRVQEGARLLGLNSEAERLEMQRRRLQRDDRSELEALARQVQIHEERYRTLSDLHAQGRAVSREQVLEVELELVRTRSAYQQGELREEREAIEYALAEAAYAERQLRSPIDGTIARIEAQSGEWLSSGALAVEVVDTQALVLRVNVPETALRGLEQDSVYPVLVAGQTDTEGRLDEISPVADAATGLVALRFAVDNSELGLRPGMEGAVRLQ